MSKKRPISSWDIVIGAVFCIALLGGGYLLVGDMLFGTGKQSREAQKLSPAQVLALGKKLYGAHCASCHGVNLEGQKNWRTRNADGTLKAPPHDASGHTWHHSDVLLFRYTKLGGAKVVGGSFKSAMPGFRDQLKDHEIRAILAFIKSRWPKDIRARQAQISRMRK